MDFVDRNGVLDAYAAWLRSKSQRLAERFERRRPTDADGAAVEATTWWWLAHLLVARIEPGETSKGGGPDFDVYSLTADSLVFSVEATAITAERFARITGVPDAENYCGPIGPTSEAVRSEVVDKLKQARRRACPVLIAVGTTHRQSWGLLDRYAARRLLTGETKIYIPVNVDLRVADGHESTEFRESVFCVLDEITGLATPVRHVAGVLLVGACRAAMYVIGALNPMADFPFDPDLMPGVPFARAVADPTAGELRVDFTLGAPEPREECYALLPEGPGTRESR